MTHLAQAVQTARSGVFFSRVQGQGTFGTGFDFQDVVGLIAEPRMAIARTGEMPRRLESYFAFRSPEIFWNSRNGINIFRLTWFVVFGLRSIYPFRVLRYEKTGPCVHCVGSWVCFWLFLQFIECDAGDGDGISRIG